MLGNFLQNLFLFLPLIVRSKPNSARSKLLQNLQRYDVVAVNDHTHSLYSADVTEKHPHSRFLRFTALEKEFDLVLNKNLNLFSENYKEYSYTPDGQTIERNVVSEHCYYVGHLRSSPDSLVAVSTCKGLRGLIQGHGSSYFIEPANPHFQEEHFHTSGKVKRRGALSEKHLVYELKDLKMNRKYHCPVGQHIHNDDNHADGNKYNEFVNILETKPNKNGRARFPFDENHADYSDPSIELLQSNDKFVEFMIVNDFRRIQEFGNENDVLENSNDIANIVTALYLTNAFQYSIQVVLVAQYLFADGDPSPISNARRSGSSVMVDSLLDNFHDWRSDNRESLPQHDNAHLFSGWDFEDNAVGFAGVGVMCNRWDSSGGIDQMSFSDSYNAAIVAHEMGHNFGMQHDSSGNPCPQSGYIMAAVGNSNAAAPNEFSRCSIEYMADFFSYNPSCLDNVPIGTWNNIANCRNGFVEDGEQCDCGRNDCTNIDPCCDGLTCILAAGALCGGDSACCDDCQLVVAEDNVVCRQLTNGCDIAVEQCTGESASCPTNTFDVAGTECESLGGGSDDGLCYNSDCHFYSGFCPQGSNSLCNCIYLDDGVPCGTSQGVVHQCRNGQCVPTSELLEVQWFAGIWTICSEECERGTQDRTVYCGYLNGTEVADGVCRSLGTNQPLDERICNDFECDACRGITCNNRGTCIDVLDGICECWGGYGGDDCEIVPTLDITTQPPLDVVPGDTITIRWDDTGFIDEVIVILESSTALWGEYATLPPLAYRNTHEFGWFIHPDIKPGRYSLRIIHSRDVEDETLRFEVGCDDSDGNPCGDYGQCDGDVCECDEAQGWRGPLCDVDPCLGNFYVPRLTCSDHGECIDRHCVCNATYVQDDLCDKPTDCDMSYRSCRNGGSVSICTDDEFVCDCPAPWSGDVCNECGLQCVNGEEDDDCSTCICTEEFGGGFCSWTFNEYTIKLNILIFDCCSTTENRDTFSRLFENDIAFALLITGDRIEVTDITSTGNSIEVDFRIYLIETTKSAQAKEQNLIWDELLRQANDENNSTVLYRGVTTRDWDKEFTIEVCDPELEDCEDQAGEDWVQWLTIIGAVLGVCLILAICYRCCCMKDKKHNNQRRYHTYRQKTFRRVSPRSGGQRARGNKQNRQNKGYSGGKSGGGGLSSNPPRPGGGARSGGGGGGNDRIRSSSHDPQRHNQPKRQLSAPSHQKAHSSADAYLAPRPKSHQKASSVQLAAGGRGLAASGNVDAFVKKQSRKPSKPSPDQLAYANC